MTKNSKDTIRLDHYIANQGLASRRKVTNFLHSHQVKISGQRAKEPGLRFNPQTDTLTINDKPLTAAEKIYYLINKPIGVVSTVTDENNRPTVVSLVKSSVPIYPVGRLDLDSHGLMLLTNDGDLAYHLTHPKYHIPKLYKVAVTGKVNYKQLTLLRHGVRLKDGKTQPAQVEKLSDSDKKTVLQITLYEGRHQQIRRMCKAVNLRVIDLKRTQIGPLTLGSLKPGESRLLTTNEVELVNSLTNH